MPVIIRMIETPRLAEIPNLLWVVVEDAEGNRGTGESCLGAGATEACVSTRSPRRCRQARTRATARRSAGGCIHVGYNCAGADVRGASAIVSPLDSLQTSAKSVVHMWTVAHTLLPPVRKPLYLHRAPCRPRGTA